MRGIVSIACRQDARRHIGYDRGTELEADADLACKPQRVGCKVEISGALAGTMRNGESLRTWILQRGHVLVSDSEGEILTHIVEDHYATDARLASSDLAEMRRAYAASGQRACMPDGVLRMIDSIRKADAVVEGAYAAFIVEPRLPGIFALQSGVELFVTKGMDENGEFTMVFSAKASKPANIKNYTSLPEGTGAWFSESALVTFNLGGSRIFPDQAL